MNFWILMSAKIVIDRLNKGVVVSFSGLGVSVRLLSVCRKILCKIEESIRNEVFCITKKQAKVGAARMAQNTHRTDLILIIEKTCILVYFRYKI